MSKTSTKYPNRQARLKRNDTSFRQARQRSEKGRNERPISIATSRPGTKGAGRTNPSRESERTGSRTFSFSATRRSARTTDHGTTTVLAELLVSAAKVSMISLNDVGDSLARPITVEGTAFATTSVD